MIIYICDIEKLHIADDYERMLLAFDEDTRKKITRFRMQEGRLSAMAREILLYGVMKEVFGNNKIVIEKNKYGKLFVSGNTYEGKYDSFDFNISHSKNVVAIAFGSNPVGIDLEPFDRVKDYEKLLRYFTDSEQRRILSSDDPQKEFCRIWTFREAFSKEEGIGLSLFEKYPVEIDYDRLQVYYNKNKLIFYEYYYNEYQITLCRADVSAMPQFTVLDENAWKKLYEYALSEKRVCTEQ